MDEIYILFILFMITYVIVLCYTHFEGIMTPLRFVQTDVQNTPCVTIDDNFYTKKECTDLLHQINNSGFIVNNPLTELFTDTTGFLLRFMDNSHLEEQFQQNNATFIYNIFTKIKNPKCNAFACNLLIIPARNNKTNVLSGIRHTDCTMEINEPYFPYRTYTPKCVSVLYLQTPNEFTDGELELYTFMGLSIKPNKIIKPKIGRLVVFRGDLKHAVKSFDSAENTPRISLVFEQYIIPSNLLHTKTFEFLSKTY